MAALLIVGALAIADKVEQKKQKKRDKRANDEKRYRELQMETNQRIARRDSATALDDSAFVDEPQESSEEENENVRIAKGEAPPPAYEDVVTAGQRREDAWKAQMQRRRSSVQSQRSGASGSESGKAKYVRMG